MATPEADRAGCPDADTDDVATPLADKAEGATPAAFTPLEPKVGADAGEATELVLTPDAPSAGLVAEGLTTLEEVGAAERAAGAADTAAVEVPDAPS